MRNKSEPAKSNGTRPVLIAAVVFSAVVFLFVGFLLFTGEISVRYADTSFTIQASFWSDITVSYDDIYSLEYREHDEPGTRTGGLGSFRLLAGAFENEEFGPYTRYSYVGCDACVVLTVAGRPLVLNGEDEAATKRIYDTLAAKIGGA